MTIDADLLKRARKVAIDRDTTLTGLIRDYLRDLVEHEELQRQIAAAELEQMFAKSTAEVGERTWTRDELHER
jgi:hypothetical protein